MAAAKAISNRGGASKIYGIFWMQSPGIGGSSSALITIFKYIETMKEF